MPSQEQKDKSLLYIDDRGDYKIYCKAQNIPVLTDSVQTKEIIVKLARTPFVPAELDGDSCLESKELFFEEFGEQGAFSTHLARMYAAADKFNGSKSPRSHFTIDCSKQNGDDFWIEVKYESTPIFRLVKKPSTSPGSKKNVLQLVLRTESYVLDLVEGLVAGTETEEAFPPSSKISLPTEPRLVLCSDKKKNEWFVGRRDDLDKLWSVFKGSKSTRALSYQAISGPGGVGKTSLALQFAIEHATDYPTQRFFCRANSYQELFEDYVRIAMILADKSPSIQDILAEPDASDYPDKIKTAIKAWLTDNKGYLLIFDNADLTTEAVREQLKKETGRAAIAAIRNHQMQVGPSELDKILQDEKWIAARSQMTEEEFATFLPAQPGGHILLTTRNDRFTGAVIAPVTVELWELPHKDAVAFLLKRIHNTSRIPAAMPEDEQVAVSDLATALHHFPLALEQAAAFIEQERWSYAKYLSKYRALPQDDEQKILAFVSKAHVRIRNYHSSVATTWQISMGAVHATNPASVEMLQFAAYIAPNNITLAMIYEARHKGCALIEAAFRSASSEDDKEDTFLALLTPLWNYSLVRSHIGRTAFDVHPMIQTVVRAILGKPKYKEGLS